MSNLTVQQQRYTQIKSYMEKEKDVLMKIIPSHVNQDSIEQTLMSTFVNNQDLMNCTKGSLIVAAIQTLAAGLNPNLGECYLIPRYEHKEKRAKFEISAKGFIKLAFQDPIIKNIYSKAVYEGDTFEYSYGLNMNLIHIPTINRTGKEKITHVYCVSELSTGAKDFTVMNAKEVYKIRDNYSQSYKSETGRKFSPWFNHEEQMFKKTVIKNHVSRLPLSTEIRRTFQQDDTVKEPDLKNITPIAETPNMIDYDKELDNPIEPELIENKAGEENEQE